VKRRICESCLYFESAGFAKNGWCHHPSRRQNTDVRLMVRSNELGCRNGWNADLWVPAATDGTVQRAQPLEGISDRAASEVEPAQQNDLITSIVAAKTDNVTLPEQRAPVPPAPVKPAVEEDIFVNQTPSLTWSAPSSGPITTQSASDLVQNPKAAILRARDQFRQRRKTEGRLADQRLAEPTSTFLASSREARLAHEHDLVQPEPDPESVDPRYENRPLLRSPSPPSYELRRPVSPVSLQEIDRPFPSMTDFPEDRARFESVPTLDAEPDDDEFLDIVQDDTWIETRQVDAVLPEPYVVDDFFEEEEIVIDDSPLPHEDEELSVPHRESILNRFLRQRRERRQHPDYVEEYIEDPLVAAVPAEVPQAAVQDEDIWLLEEPYLEDIPATPPVSDPAQIELQSRYEFRETSRDVVLSVPDRRRESRQPAQPSVLADDDFVIPPPLPEYRPSDDPPARSFEIRRGPRIEPARDTRRPRMVEAEPTLADEFGDQPLFATQPTPRAEDFEIEAPYARTEHVPITSQRLERICQTCRDFRPSENGERGWCNNKWAFNHRRMVDADDLACRNSLGSWWTPKDESWRRDGDISRHAQQTPRVDQWLLGSRENDTDRRRSGS
jgi:hypothetical protein